MFWHWYALASSDENPARVFIPIRADAALTCDILFPVFLIHSPQSLHFISMKNPLPSETTIRSKDDRWRILGPGGGGCVHTLTINPHHPDTFVVSCDMTAGYITHDGGKRWCEFNLRTRQWAYAFDPVDPDTCYVGTSGLFRSIDDGVTWQLLFPAPADVLAESRLGDESVHLFHAKGTWPGKSIAAILVDPQDRDRLYLAIKRDGFYIPADFYYGRKKCGLYIYASADRGQRWRRLAELDSDDVNLLDIDPATPPDERALFVFTGQELYRIPVSGGCESLPLPDGLIHLRHASSGVYPASGRKLFFIAAIIKTAPEHYESNIWRSDDNCQTWQKSLSYGILRSDDAGVTWRWVVKHDDFHDPENREFGWPERDYGAQWGDIIGEAQVSPKGRFAWDVVASPVDPDVAYSMDFSTIYVTRDGGASWKQLVSDLHPDGTVSSRGIDVLVVYGVLFDPFDPQHIVFPATDAGLFHSLDGGRTWRHNLQGVPRAWINTCYWMVFDPDVPGRAWSVWTAMHNIPHRVAMLRDEFFERDQGGICKSDDGLRSWRPSASGLPSLSRCTHILLDPATPLGQRTLYTAVYDDGVYKSTDDGQTWQRKSQGIDPRNRFVWRLAQAPDGTLYVVVAKNRRISQIFSGGIYRSTDGAETWEALPMPDGVDFPSDLTIDSSGRLYLACWPRLEGDKNTGGGVYASDDGGQTWNLVFNPEMHVVTVSIDPHHPSTLYIGTFDAALFRSTDRGQTWRQVEGFDFQWGYRPVPDPHHPGLLYMTTFGSSVWYGLVDGA